MENQQEIFFDIYQLSQIMGVNPHTVRDMVKRGNYPPPRQGKYNKHFFKKSEVEFLICLIVEGVWKPDSCWDDLVATHRSH